MTNETISRGAISKDKNRDDVLAMLIPKCLGMLVEAGHKTPALGGCSLILPESQVELSARYIDADRIMLSVYWPIKDKITKVFSAHLINRRDLGDPSFYRYLDGQLSLLGWRRGEWEDVIVSHSARERSISEVITGRLINAQSPTLN